MPLFPVQRLLLVAMLITSEAASMAAAPVLRDDPPPEATFLDASGKTVKLSDYRGKRALVLLFMRGFTGEFACYHCNRQTHAYKDGYARVQAAGAEVLAVLPGAKDAPGFLEKIGTSVNDHPDPGFTVPFPVVLDPGFAACRTFLVAFDPRPEAFPFPVSEPATIVLGKDGHVAYTYHGTDPSDRPSIDAILDVLEGRPPRVEKKSASNPSAAPASTPSPASKLPPKLPWKNYAEGLSLARAQGQPVLLDFHALW